MANNNIEKKYSNIVRVGMAVRLDTNQIVKVTSQYDWHRADEGYVCAYVKDIEEFKLTTSCRRYSYDGEYFLMNLIDLRELTDEEAAMCILGKIGDDKS